MGGARKNMGVFQAAVCLIVCMLEGAAAACTRITPRDALFIVDTQNSFMDSISIPHNPPPQYPIPPAQQQAGHVKPGALAVANTSQIIQGINTWIGHFEASGGRIFASLDWHPSGHCSFCRNGTASTNPTGTHPHGAVCPALPV